MLSELLQHQAEAIAAQYLPPETGRPSSISDADKVAELLAVVEAGNYLETACELAGISTDSVRRWLKRGEAGEEPHKTFCAALKRASARAEALAVANVRKAGQLPQFWAAEMTYLERRHPERWGRRNESSDSPKVIIQIGARDSDIQVSTFASSPSLSPVDHKDLACVNPLQVDIWSPINSDSVTQPLPSASPGRTVRRSASPPARVRGRRKRQRQIASGAAAEKKGAE